MLANVPVSSGRSEVHSVRLSLSNCMIKVLSLYDSSLKASNSTMASSNASFANWHALKNEGQVNYMLCALIQWKEKIKSTEIKVSKSCLYVFYINYCLNFSVVVHHSDYPQQMPLFLKKLCEQVNYYVLWYHGDKNLNVLKWKLAKSCLYDYM